ncbi:MAG: substrate-binding domain-containing protein [Eubacteriales bacterium]|nr:substrate-binding domain-containing protein [Eubacteriales bacterium]
MSKNRRLGKSIICAILAAAVITAVFAGCKASSEDNGETPAAAGVTGQISVASREDGSGTRDAFTELMGIVDEEGNDNTAAAAEITSSTSVMTATVAGNEKAIGYVSLGSLSDDVKAVSLDGVAPSTDTVKDGSYKLQRPFVIAYKDGELSDLAQDFISYILSADGQAVIEEEGYISTGSETAYTASGLKGTVTISGSTSVAPVMEVLADKYKELNPEVQIEIQQPGSGAGIEAAIEGAVEIAMSSRELKDEEKATLTPVQIALDGIAVIVNNNNDVSNLTAEQIKSIFTGETTAWEDVK